MGLDFALQGGAPAREAEPTIAIVRDQLDIAIGIDAAGRRPPGFDRQRKGEHRSRQECSSAYFHARQQTGPGLRWR